MNAGASNRELPARTTAAIFADIEVTSHYLNWIYGLLHEMEPTSYTDKVGKETTWVVGAGGKPTTIIRLKEQSNKMTPNDIAHHRAGHCSTSSGEILLRVGGCYTGTHNCTV